MLEFKNITKKYKTDFWVKPFTVLDNISFRMREGGITGFLGANGAGKTTSQKIMLQFITPDEGEVVYSKKLGSGLNIFRKIGFFPERPYFYPHLTGYEFLDLMCEITEVKSIRKDKIIKDWSVIFKIDHAIQRKIRTYSKGMLQRLGFIASIIHDPELIILDEPMAGLDPIGRKEFKEIMLKLWRQGKTIFFSSHIVSDIEEICSNVIVLEKGSIIYQGDVEKLLNQGGFEQEERSDLYELKVLNFKENIGSYKLSYSIPKEQQNFVAIYEIPSIELQEILKTLIDKKIKIISVVNIRPTLEEIVYKIKK